MINYDTPNITIPEFIDFINLAQIDPKVIVEIGCMDAADAILLKETYPLARTLAIEGLLENYETFKDRTDIESINRIIASYDGTITFHKKTINGIHGIYNRGDNFGTETIINSPCSTLLSLAKEFNIPLIDVLKLDVEGATLDVLESAKDFLQKIKIMHIETETYEFFAGQRLEGEVFNFLDQNNFSLIQYKSVSITGLDQCQSDSIWINNNLQIDYAPLRIYRDACGNIQA